MSIERRFPGFFGRLRVYLAGVSIGMVLLGFFHLAKRNEAAARQAASDHAAQQPQPGGPFPPLPDSELRK